MPIANAILVRWTGGNTWVEDAGSIVANGRREQTLKLPGITSAGQAQQVAGAVLSLRSQPRVRTTAGHLPVTEAGEPFTAYQVGDFVTAPGPDGTPVDLRVQSVTVNERDDGVLEFTPELGSPIDELEDRIARFLSKFGTAPATENGSSSGGDPAGGDPIGGGDPTYDVPAPSGPEPVNPTEPWVDPTLIDGDLLGTTNIGNQDPEEPGTPDPDDPGLLNIFATVIVPGPDEGDDPTLKIEDGEITFGEDSEVNFDGDANFNGDTEINGPTKVSATLDFATRFRPPGADDDRPDISGGWKADDAQKENPTIGLLWEAAKSFIGRLSGTKGSATDSTYVDKNGNWHFAQAVDFTDATVTGLTPPVTTVADEVLFGKGGRLRLSQTNVGWRAPFDLDIYEVRCELGVTGTGGQIDLLHQGNPAYTFSPTGSDSTPLAVAEGEYLQPDVPDGGAGNFNALISVRYTHSV